MTTQERIDGFLRLPKGWYFGEGIPADRKCHCRAINLVRLAEAAGFETEAFPGCSGEIMVSIYKGDFSADISFEVGPRYQIDIDVEGESDFEVETFEELAEWLESLSK